jgi:hypothetical protein
VGLNVPIGLQMHQSPTERSVVLIVEDEFLIRMAAEAAEEQDRGVGSGKRDN